MERIHLESLWLGCPLFADEFVGREPLEGFEPAPEVVGVNKVSEVLPQLSMSLIVEAFDSGFLDGPVHPLDLPIGPRMLDFGQAVLNAMLLANPSEDVLKGVPV